MKCRVEQYYNEHDYKQTGIRIWKPSTMHVFKGKKNRCQCGKARW